MNLRKIMLFPALAALLLCTALEGQQLRTNYVSAGMSHVSTEFEKIAAEGKVLYTRVELVGFPDGGSLYLLYIDLEQKESAVAPKGVKMAVTLDGGGLVRLEQIGRDSATKRRLDSGYFRNRLKYAVEPADMDRLRTGIKALDIVTGWNPEDYLQIQFRGNEFGSLLERHCKLIAQAASSTVELAASLAAYDQSNNTVMISSNPIVGKGSRYIYNIILNLIYYKNTGGEDMDLSFLVGTADRIQIPFDATVRFTLRDDSVIELSNMRNDVNFAFVYPSREVLHRIACTGVASIAVIADGKVLLDDAFPEGTDDFSSAVNQQIQILLSASPA